MQVHCCNQSAQAGCYDQLVQTQLTLVTRCLYPVLTVLRCLLQGGIYYLQVMDWYSSTFSLMIISFAECMVIAWIYGKSRVLVHQEGIYLSRQGQ